MKPSGSKITVRLAGARRLKMDDDLFAILLAAGAFDEPPPNAPQPEEEKAATPAAPSVPPVRIPGVVWKVLGIVAAVVIGVLLAYLLP